MRGQCTTRAARSGARGVSLVELMIGAAAGLVLMLGAIRLFVDHLHDNRYLLLEARLHQDLRAASDLIARDLRRAGHWRAALDGVSDPAAANPYRQIATSGTALAGSVAYSFSRDSVENQALDLAEVTGFRLSNGVLQSLNGGAWQAVTDVQVLRVTRLSIEPDVRPVPLGHYCTPACAPASAGCPALELRSYRIRLAGHASGNTAMQREVHGSVRVRNDAVPLARCP